MVGPHPDADTLANFGLGRLPEDRRSSLEAHIESCPECALALDRGANDTLLNLAQKAIAADTDTIPAELIDHPRYRVAAKLGSGGMGVVYRAEHRMMGRTVALKVLNASALSKPGALDRFRREVRLASKLQHPNIVTAYDADEANGQHFLIMELVDGISLDRFVAKRGPLSVAMACHFARQVALGLQHAAGLGMVHRDIKPHNLMVTRRGVVKILDFGLAMVAQGDDAGPETAARMTAPETIMGTPDFLAPEQARSASEVDGRADIYALGGTIYFLLTGKPPFAGGNAFEKLLAHVDTPAPNVAKVRPEVPPALAQLIQSMMAKSPAERPATAGEVAAALAPFARGIDPPNVSVPITPEPDVATVVDEPRPRKLKKKPTNRRQWWWAAAGVLPLILLAAVFVPKLGGGGAGGSSVVGGGGRKLPVLFLLPPTDLYYADFAPVQQAFNRAGVPYKLATAYGNTVTRYKDTPGPPITTELELPNVNPDEFDGIVIFGAGVNIYKPAGGSNSHVRTVIENMLKRQRVVAAICVGQDVLRTNGYLNNRRAAKANFVSEPPQVRLVTQPVVIDTPFVTGGAFPDAPAFADAVLEQLRRQR